MDKYIVISSKEAKELGYVSSKPFNDDGIYLIYQTDGEKPIKLIGCDVSTKTDKFLIKLAVSLSKG